jgi:hypothetical protein
MRGEGLSGSAPRPKAGRLCLAVFASLSLTACLRPPGVAPVEPTPELEAVQAAFAAGDWSAAAQLGYLFFWRSNCAKGATPAPGSRCYAAGLIRAKSLAKLARSCEALAVYQYLQPPSGTNEAVELHVLEERVRARQGTGAYRVRLELVLKDHENLQLVSFHVWFDSSPPTPEQRLDATVTGGCHVAKVDASLRGRGRLVGYKFGIVSHHLFEPETTAALNAALLEDPSTHFPVVHYEDVSRE